MPNQKVYHRLESNKINQQLKKIIMKKIMLPLIFSLVTISIFAQLNEAPKRLKYVTKAPDGSVAMTIIDDSREDTMKLESANSFYKYQILDQKTSKPIYSSNNTGKECYIDKSKVAAGTYDIRLFTNKFVITSRITVSASHMIAKIMQEDDVVAIND